MTAKCTHNLDLKHESGIYMFRCSQEVFEVRHVPPHSITRCTQLPQKFIQAATESTSHNARWPQSEEILVWYEG